jgi:hypothetical protein
MKNSSERYPTLLFQDFLIPASDIAEFVSFDQQYYCDERAYYVVPTSELNRTKIAEGLTARGTIEMFGILSSREFRPEDVDPDRQLKRESLRQFAEATVEIYVGAYDQEGLVFWRR